MITRAMLSASAATHLDLRTHFPYEGALASPKLDGIRCLLHPDLGTVTRNFKPIPNKHIREALAPFAHIDGEVMTYTNGVIDDFNTVQSKVMTQAGVPDFKLLVFDCFINEDLPFVKRYEQLCQFVAMEGSPFEVVPHTLINNPDDFLDYAGVQLAAGFEGAMFRSIHGKYKSGRSTLNQGWLVKWKDIQDAEGKVVGFVEQMHNNNEATTDLLGLQERSSHKENMVGKNTLGALLLKTEWGELRVGTGFDDVTRQRIWNNQDAYMDRIVTFKYQPFGVKNLPRFPVFKSFREAE